MLPVKASAGSGLIRMRTPPPHKRARLKQGRDRTLPSAADRRLHEIADCRFQIADAFKRFANLHSEMSISNFIEWSPLPEFQKTNADIR